MEALPEGVLAALLARRQQLPMHASGAGGALLSRALQGELDGTAVAARAVLLRLILLLPLLAILLVPLMSLRAYVR